LGNASQIVHSDGGRLSVSFRRMTADFAEQLRAQAFAIQSRWRTLLHLEPVSGPLANPEAMQHLIPQAFAQIIALACKSRHPAMTLERARAELPDCGCGHNPYRAFFVAAEQALTEAAVLIQAAQPAARRTTADLAQLIFAVRMQARAEIDTFCSVCTHRDTAANCRFTVAKT
jgi:hypothetical protein